MAGPWKITMLFNRFDVEGWSETYYTTLGSTPSTAITALAGMLNARYALCALGVYLWGYRISAVGVQRASTLIKLTNTISSPSSAAQSAALGPDSGGVGVQGTFLGQNGRGERRLLRGLPDSWIGWSASLNRMVLLPIGMGPVTAWSKMLTAAANGCGWYSRSALLPPANGATLVTALTSNADGSFSATVANPFTPTYGNPLIFSGFRKPSAAANGTYAMSEWSISGAGPYIIKVRRPISPEAATSYVGVGGYVRRADATFVPYVSGTEGTFDLVSTRNIGRPFGQHRGRRLVAR